MSTITSSVWPLTCFRTAFVLSWCLQTSLSLQVVCLTSLLFALWNLSGMNHCHKAPLKYTPRWYCKGCHSTYTARQTYQKKKPPGVILWPKVANLFKEIEVNFCFYLFAFCFLWPFSVCMGYHLCEEGSRDCVDGSHIRAESWWPFKVQRRTRACPL